MDRIANKEKQNTKDKKGDGPQIFQRPKLSGIQSDALSLVVEAEVECDWILQVSSYECGQG
jgi:hypothetical protein